ncbi:MAG: DUF481 domain-containing protein [Gammaproteobacteria bacterium]|nr:DUF481 domain-containing protein [Gammaproteobacteria bacterium]MCF6364559.1 DUF481 domain-containing protein [Gammaproteobacteria bacterium]
MNRNSLSIAILTACLAPGLASADWKGEAELGYVKTGGNTDTSTINAKAKAEQELDKWRNTLVIEALNTSNDGSTNAERYLANGQSNYKITERGYFFGFLGYEADRFSGYEYRATANIGYGHRVVQNDKVTLDLEVAPGARQNQIKRTDTTPEKTEDEFTVRGALKLLWNVSKTTKFTEDLTTEIGDRDKGGAVTRSVTALTAQIAGNLHTKISYTLRHSSVVPAGKEKVDDEVAIALLYNFGK